MNIAYSTDENYVRHCYISIHSLLNSNKKEKEINLYIICNNVSSAAKSLLKNLADSYSKTDLHRNVYFIDFKKYVSLVGNAIPWGSLSAYGRLFLTDIVKDDRVLYLDCDTVICSSLSNMYSSILKGFALAGVQDNAGPVFREKVGLDYGERYINSGMCLLNLDYWRKHDGTRKCIEFIKSYEGNVPLADQGTLNGVFKGKIKILHPRYNVMTPMFDFKADNLAKFFEVGNYYTNEELEEAVKDPAIIHYTGGFYVRPWYKNTDHPKADVYKYYMDLSPWAGKYFPEINLGKRTEMMCLTYRYLPFSLFIVLHRIIRKLKRFKESY